MTHLFMTEPVSSFVKYHHLDLNESQRCIIRGNMSLYLITACKSLSCKTIEDRGTSLK